MVSEKIAEILLHTQAVKLQPHSPFTWSSGWKSPIYCDNRVTLSFPDERTYIKNALAEAVKTQFPSATAIAGVATAGIAQGALLADVLNLPYAYVRPEPKKHGMGNQIEGRLAAGSQVVIIEDLISTGGSSLKVVEAVRNAGFDVLGMLAIFTYGFPVAAENFAKAGLPLVTLSDYSALIQAALKANYIDASMLESLSDWRQNPETWGQ